MAAAHHKADNLIAIVDRNHIQNDGFSDYDRYPGNPVDGGRPGNVAGGWVMADGHTANIMTLDPLEKKFEAFGWKTYHLPDGHDFDALIRTIEEARAHSGQPTAIICETIKGKGVSFMENNADYHGKALTEEQLVKALEELVD
jgi:transketolase